MATLASTSDVSAILDNTQLTDAQIQVFIDTAENIIYQYLGSGLDANNQKELEKYLAAHLISIGPERQAQQEGAGTASIKYTGVFGKMLESTTYGQMVMFLDASGILASLGGQKITFHAIKGYPR